MHRPTLPTVITEASREASFETMQKKKKEKKNVTM